MDMYFCKCLYHVWAIYPVLRLWWSIQRLSDTDKSRIHRDIKVKQGRIVSTRTVHHTVLQKNHMIYEINHTLQNSQRFQVYVLLALNWSPPKKHAIVYYCGIQIIQSLYARLD